MKNKTLLFHLPAGSPEPLENTRLPKCCPTQSPSRSGSAVRFLEGAWALKPWTLRRASGRSRTSSRKPPDSLLDQSHSNKEAVPKDLVLFMKQRSEGAACAQPRPPWPRSPCLSQPHVDVGYSCRTPKEVPWGPGASVVFHSCLFTLALAFPCVLFPLSKKKSDCNIVDLHGCIICGTTQ